MGFLMERTAPRPPELEWPSEGVESVPFCPACGDARRETLHAGLRDRVFFCAPGRWTLHRCIGCGSGYLDPRPNAATIALAYRDYYTHGEPEDPLALPVSSRRLRRMRLRNGYLNTRYGYAFQPADPRGDERLPWRRKIHADRMVRHLPLAGPGARLLDVGCGNGGFLHAMRRAGWEVAGLEPDARAASAAAALGIPVTLGLLEADSFPEASFDAVTLSHVIEHLHDPPTILNRCFRVLRPGGALWIATPNLDSLGHDRFGADWFALDPPRHLVLFTPDALRRAAARAGFDVAGGLLPSCDARGMFLASTHVARGEDPIRPPRLPQRVKLRVKWLARAADARVRREPHRAEELVLRAAKPSRASR